MITLLDYGAGNVRSVINAIEKLGASVRVAAGPADIERAEKLVFPGVGNFGSMMQVLAEKGYVPALHAYLQSDRPFLGICLGFQALFETSDEAPDVRGLGFFSGSVRRFEVDLSVPHIGWNGVCLQQETTLFNDLSGNEKFYFVHSYHVVPADPGVVLTTTHTAASLSAAFKPAILWPPSFIRKKAGRPDWLF